MARNSVAPAPVREPSGSTAGKTIRCAIYTRKSTEEGLQQEFNSLDAQREAGEAFIVSQKNEGWQVVADRFDDGGYTGGNMDRPALKRLLSAVKAGSVDCVVLLCGIPLADQKWALDTPAKSGTIEKVTINSSILKTKREISVYTPPGYDASGGPYPLILYFRAQPHVPVILDNLIAPGRLRPTGKWERRRL